MRHILMLMLLAALALPATASGSPSQIYDDCQDGRLDRGYAGKDLRAALKDMPKDLDEYTNCREIIRSAQHGVRGPGGSGPVGENGGPAPSSGGYGSIGMGDGGLPVGADKRQVDPIGFADEREREEITKARADARAGLIPASAGQAPGAPSAAGLPFPLILLLVLLGGAIATVAGTRIRDLVRHRAD